MRGILLAVAIAAAPVTAAAADCAFGGPCGDGSPYGNWNQQWSAREPQDYSQRSYDPYDSYTPAPTQDYDRDGR